MNTKDLQLYVDDAINTLENLSQSFIIIINNLEENQKNRYFIKNNLPMNISSFKEFSFYDSVIVEYLCINILSVIDIKQLDVKNSKNSKISHYDILKLGRRIYGCEKRLNIDKIDFIDFEKEYSKICYDKLSKFKYYRDKHYSHIDRKRKVDNVFVGDLVDTVKIFLNLFDKIYSKFKNQSIFDLSLDYNLFEVKLKAFKYDIMIKYLNETENPDLNRLKLIDNNSTFEDSYKLLFMGDLPIQYLDFNKIKF